MHEYVTARSKIGSEREFNRNLHCYMENFIVSARKYRPVNFDAVVGQKTVTTTLQNAIKSKHLAQAYLFCGPRGVGKTTCARILARTINCENITGNTEACDQCESCQSFNESRSFNIHELDAASNNSVDDIRNLIEQVRIPPQVGNFSIYIIDEVHMLSAQAFNTFLKTLEEPPAHAIFILATTEKHKIIPTILSRCQIFDFNRIRLDDIVSRLQYVAEKENIQAEQDALHIIALKADGAMRDALSIFDQIVSFSGVNISYLNVIENLNVLDYEYYFKLTQTFLEAESAQSLLLLDEIISKGFDPHHLITGLSSHLRDILVCKDPATVQLLDASASFRERYLTQAQACEPDFLFKALDALSSADVQYRMSKNPRLLTELTLIRCCRITDGPSQKKKAEPEKSSGRQPPVVPGSDAKEEPSESKSDPGYVSEPPTKSPTDLPKELKRPDPVQYAPRTTSIKAGLNGAGAVKNEPDKEQIQASGNRTKREESFTQDQLIEKWMEYSERIRENKPRLATALKTQTPKIEKDGLIVVEMENSNQKDDFVNYLKNEIQEYLKQALKNDRIHITAIVKDAGPLDHKPYTEEEKFRHLSEKNPNLLTLKKKLGLDFE